MRADGLSTKILSLVVAVAALLLAGCDGRRRDWGSCYTEPCGDGSVCTSDHRCVPQAVQPDAGFPDVGASFDLPVDGRAVDLHVTDASGVDRESDSLSAADAAIEAEPDVADVPIAPDAAFDLGVDTSVPDAPGSCADDHDCPDHVLPFCINRVCVACKTREQCGGGAPACSAAHTCVSCATVDAGCTSAAPVCEADSGRCLECLGDGDCKGSPEKSFCVREACAGCTAAAPGACAARDPAKPACVASGICAECASNADCAGNKPICDTAAHTCKACASDTECGELPGGPGVCMAQQGHCATDTETIYVGTRGAAHCSDSQASGSATMPFCSLQLAVTAAKARSLSLLVLSGPIGGGFAGVSLAAPLTMVGKNAVITPAAGADGIGIVAGELTLRGITVRGNASTSTGTGINAAATSGNAVVLRMDTCAVTDNPGGGIFLNGAAFVIRNTTVSRNGPSSTGWGGIAVQNPPGAGPTTLDQVTISDNKQVGLVCSASLAATNAGSGVLATGNIGGVEISSTCGIQRCAAGNPGCGAQSLP